MAYLEEVFRLSGVPTHTFVHPERYDEIKVSMRTPGRCMVVEGPSGIGKTTTIARVLDDLDMSAHVLSLSARRPKDVDLIRSLPEMDAIGTVIVDDFHRLPDDIKAGLSDFMKVLADSEDDKSKLILVGINKAGTQLVKFAHDLGLRIDVFKLEANPKELIQKVIHLGEEALNVSINGREELADRAQGSFQLVQLLCHKMCVLDGVTETLQERRTIETSVNVVVEDVINDLSRQFKEAAITFARGSKLRKEGRAPYLHILRWLSQADEWSLDLAEAMAEHPDMKGSISQVIDKGWLQALLDDPEKTKVLGPYFHFEPSTSVLSVEDPKLIFYLKNIIWRVFTRQVGYKADYFEGRFDFALSFAGANRSLAEKIFALLSEREVSCFYDENEQHRIISQNVEDYLAPIYRSEARYVVVLQSPEYPTRIWTKFESDHFRERFGRNEVIPIRFTTVVPGFFTEDAKYGGLAFDPKGDEDEQAGLIVDMLCKRLIEDRSESKAAEAEEAMGVNVATE
ncbi:TIR domain-containing protein [Pseudorhizobium halotolerans]|uniref:TIR domain-containing protein n=1 Tax=Pseudorhizobium halotolerans TaxID=1233081 RepID=A0ABM8PLE5_9HYPH|nr:TIR domain-containing protein [Pseudorhizobium halotolerans]CAD7036216.1 TIR domain-containing protein [Pseudorhizobium halotolerans]